MQRTVDESHSLRSAWIEIKKGSSLLFPVTSHSLRSAWIEIKSNANVTGSNTVALLTECVDRNLLSLKGTKAEDEVALLTECVDRNVDVYINMIWLQKSHSLRSAWIEISFA